MYNELLVDDIFIKSLYQKNPQLIGYHLVSKLLKTGISSDISSIGYFVPSLLEVHEK